MREADTREQANISSTVGRVAGLFVSRGGVPKTPIPSGVVSSEGLEGDGHADSVNHGGPRRALCLWSSEVVDALRAEGHPIAAGNAGENISLSGIDWPSVTPGTRLRIGEVSIEITKYTTPCHKNAGWFVDGRFDRMSQDSHPGCSRVYASVLREGRVSVGDRVLVEPHDDGSPQA